MVELTLELSAEEEQILEIMATANRISVEEALRRAVLDSLERAVKAG